MKSSRLLWQPCLLTLALAASLCVAQTYTVTDLGTTPGMDWSVARAINVAHQVTGASGKSNSNLSGVFLYSNGTMTNLGTLGGNTGVGNGINSSGQIAGYSQNASGTYRAFISNGTTLTDIGDLGGGSAVAYAINDLGQVVGSAVTADHSNHPFLYSNGQMIDLGTLGSHGNSWWNSAQSINNKGMVTGTSYDAQGNFFGFLWSNRTMTKIGTLGGPWSQGYAINNKGQITGVAYTANGNAHAFIRSVKGRMKDLGTFAGKFSTLWGFAINDSGVVVGQSTFQDTYHAFVYRSGTIKDLNTLIPPGSGWELNEAEGINSAGEIVGLGIRNGLQRAYLLTPQ